MAARIPMLVAISGAPVHAFESHWPILQASPVSLTDAVRRVLLEEYSAIRSLRRSLRQGQRLRHAARIACVEEFGDRSPDHVVRTMQPLGDLIELLDTTARPEDALVFADPGEDRTMSPCRRLKQTLAAQAASRYVAHLQESDVRMYHTLLADVRSTVRLNSRTDAPEPDDDRLLIDQIRAFILQRMCTPSDR